MFDPLQNDSPGVDDYYSIYRADSDSPEWFYFYQFEEGHRILHSTEGINYATKYKAAIAKFRKLLAFV